MDADFLFELEKCLKIFNLYQKNIQDHFQEFKRSHQDNCENKFLISEDQSSFMTDFTVPPHYIISNRGGGIVGAEGVIQPTVFLENTYEAEVLHPQG